MTNKPFNPTNPVAPTNPPTVAHPVATPAVVKTSKHINSGEYDLAPFSNALNNVLNLRNTPDKDAILAEFEAQLCTILEVSSIAPDAFNKLVDDKSQTPGQTFEGHGR